MASLFLKEQGCWTAVEVWNKQLDFEIVLCGILKIFYCEVKSGTELRIKFKNDYECDFLRYLYTYIFFLNCRQSKPLDILVDTLACGLVFHSTPSILF